MILDEAVFEELSRAGGGSAQDIKDRLGQRVYEALERLVLAERIVKEGFPGKGNPKTYSLPKPPPFERRI
jgi:hypothetical protein